MTDLKASVQAAIGSFVRSKHETHIDIDVLRVIRDQAHLLFERQRICDELDADPLNAFDDEDDEDGGVHEGIQRMQRIMSVHSCSRCRTLDGQCWVEAVVRFQTDKTMKNVSDHVQLTFCYNKRRQESSGYHPRGSHVIYNISAGKDYGPQERLLTIEVWASGEGPSREPPVPIEFEEWEDMSGEGDGDGDQRHPPNDTRGINKSEMDSLDEADGKSMMEIEASGGEREIVSSDDTGADQDRYAAYMDPDVLADFLLWTQLDMDEYTAFIFLMTFPFYEHEWDLIGLVLDSVFATTEELELEEDEDEGK